MKKFIRRRFMRSFFVIALIAGVGAFMLTSDVHATTLNTVRIVTTDSYGEEYPANFIRINLVRSGNLSQALDVDMRVWGSAIMNRDYAAYSRGLRLQSLDPSRLTCRIFPGQTTALMVIQPMRDTLVEGSETVHFDILPSANYTRGSPNSGGGSIRD